MKAVTQDAQPVPACSADAHAEDDPCADGHSLLHERCADRQVGFAVSSRLRRLAQLSTRHRRQPVSAIGPRSALRHCAGMASGCVTMQASRIRINLYWPETTRATGIRPLSITGATT